MSLFSKKSLEFELVTTKTGDDGKSAMFSGERKYKHDIRFKVMGDLDELNSWLGVIRGSVSSLTMDIALVQSGLYRSMSTLATNPDHELYENLSPITDLDVNAIEHLQKKIYKEVDIPQRFVTPGEINTESAKFDFARALARRCERGVVEYIQETSVASYSNFHDIKMIQQYLNRLSDYLFVAARYVEKKV